GTGSPVLTDDLEVYERAQHGLTTARSDWVYLGRGHGGDVPDEDRTWRGKTGAREIHIRNQLVAWGRDLTGDSRAPMSRASTESCPRPARERGQPRDHGQ